MAPGCLESEGIAVSGYNIFESCNGGWRTIYQVEKGDADDDGVAFEEIANFPGAASLTADLECDPLTFAGRDVIWSKAAFLNEVFAVEIDRGSCNFGGTAPSPSPVVGTACCPTDLDTDRDGLLDCWEDMRRIDDGDCVNDADDFQLSDYPTSGENPDKNHADLYVELDYMNGVAPSRTALDNVKAAFASGTNMNPDATTGVRFHYQVDEDVNGDSSTVFLPCSNNGPGTSFDAWKAARFGTAGDRATIFLQQTADSDGDGVDNLQDNCIFAPNPSQADGNANGIGDVCEVLPIVCVIIPGDRDDVRAVWGYNNANYSLAIPVGPDNALSGGPTPSPPARSRRSSARGSPAPRSRRSSITRAR